MSSRIEFIDRNAFLAMIENACRDVPWEKYAKGWNF
jgi:hypothetical protein